MSNLIDSSTIRPILGCVQLKPHLYNFLLSNENIPLIAENPVLDICKNTLISRELRMYCRDHSTLRNQDVNRKFFPVKLRFQLPINDPYPDRIFFDSQATYEFNNFIHYYMIETLNRHVRNFLDFTGGMAKDGYLDFIKKNGLEKTDLDWESLKKAEFRLRKEKLIENY
jgi:hypothetical protein